VESIASGWGIVARARQQIQEATPGNLEGIADLLARCQEQPENLTGQHVASAAGEGNPLAAEILDHAIRVLGWAIAQVITLQAPEVIVVGGGVSLIGEKNFFEPLRAAVAQYVFSPLRDSYQVLPAALGELAVVHGAIIQANRDGSA
jgi:glucokinase